MSDTPNSQPELPPPPAQSVAPAAPPPPAADPALTGNRSDGWLLGVIIMLAAVALFAAGTRSAYHAEQRNDQYQLLGLGRSVLDGGRLYLDNWENKPPGIAWLNALGLLLSGDGRLFAWVLPGLLGLVCVAIMGWAINRLLGPIAALGTVLIASAVFTLRLYDGATINPDYYSAIFELAACSMFLVALECSCPGRCLASALSAGLLWAVAMSVKQTGVVGLVVVTLVAAVAVVFMRADHRRWRLAPIGTWIGFAAGIGAVLFVLRRQELLAPAWEAVFTFNRDLASFGNLSAAVRSWSRAQTSLSVLQLPIWLGVVGMAATFFARKDKPLSTRIVIALFVWWAAHVVLALIGPSQSMRYWHATFPAMLWLCAAGIWSIQHTFLRVEKGFRVPLAVVTATVVLMLGRPLAGQYRVDLASSALARAAGTTERDRLSEWGERLKRLAPPGARIYVWAYHAGIYLYADRRPASRFTYPRSAEQMREILSDLADGKAHVFLMKESGAPQFNQYCDEICQQDLAVVLAEYEAGPSIGPYLAWIKPSGANDDTDTSPQEETGPPEQGVSSENDR